LISTADDQRVPGQDPEIAALRSGGAGPDPTGAGTAPRPPDVTAVAVLSDAFWHRRYGASADVLGRAITLDGVPFTIVGVTPPGFFGPEVGRTFDVAVPLAAEPLTRPRSMLDARRGWWVFAFARLRPGESIDDATRALTSIQSQVRAATAPAVATPAELQRYLGAPMALAPASTGVSDMRRAYSTPLSIVMAVVGLVLLIACVNLANLLLARADARRQEMSVRLAIGASRPRLVVQLLVESLLLAFGGAALGVLVAEAGSNLLVAQISGGPSVALPVPIDWRVLGFTVLVAVGAALVFGIAPALRATDTTPNDALAAQGRSISGRPSPLGGVLVAAQVALSLVLVIAAGLFVRTFTSLAHAPLGIDADSLLIVSLDAQNSATPPAGRLPLIVRARDAVRALPGVADVSLSAMAPFAGQWDTLVDNPDGMSLTEDQRDVYLNSVSAEWFSTYGVPVREGRGLNAEDARITPLQSAVINRTAAQRFFPGRSAVGQTLSENRAPRASKPWTIVGVVDDAVYDSVRSGVPPTMYEPLATSQPVTSLTMTVRAGGGSPDAIAKGVVAAIGGVDPKISVSVDALDTRVAAALMRERLLAWLSGFFGALALLLAGLGLYGVVSYDTSRRRREIGIRLALGARTSTVVTLLARRVAWLVTAGLAAGAILSAWCAQFVATLLFGLDARDVATFAGASVILIVVAAIAAGIPARRATRLDPTTVLRET
jgi:predicted permease